MEAMKLRPHHLLDIITAYGKGSAFAKSPWHNDILHRGAPRRERGHFS